MTEDIDIVDDFFRLIETQEKKSVENISSSRAISFDGLVEREVFKISENDFIYHRVHGNCFDDTIEAVGQPSSFKKSLLEIKAYGDTDYGLLTYAPTVNSYFQLLLCQIAAIFSEDNLVNEITR